jgi:hypothetical protein
VEDGQKPTVFEQLSAQNALAVDMIEFGRKAVAEYRRRRQLAGTAAHQVYADGEVLGRDILPQARDRVRGRVALVGGRKLVRLAVQRRHHEHRTVLQQHLVGRDVPDVGQK